MLNIISIKYKQKERVQSKALSKIYLRLIINYVSTVLSEHNDYREVNINMNVGSMHLSTLQTPVFIVIYDKNCWKTDLITDNGRKNHQVFLLRCPLSCLLFERLLNVVELQTLKRREEEASWLGSSK